METRSSDWRKHLDEKKKRKKEVHFDSLSGETDYDKVGFSWIFLFMNREDVLRRRHIILLLERNIKVIGDKKIVCL